MPDYQLAASRAARRHGIRPDIFQKLIAQESGYDPKAVSPAGARGIAQFMPGTAQAMGVDLDDGRAADDLDGSARLIAKLLKKYGGSYRKALAAYNAGEGAVDKHGGVPPYPETQNYVKKILGSQDPLEDAMPTVQNRLSGSAATKQVTVAQGIGDRVRNALDFVDGKTDPLEFIGAQRATADVTLEVPVPGDTLGDDGDVPTPKVGGNSLPSLGRSVERIAKRQRVALGSGVRSHEENAAVGGAEDSDHLPGDDRWARDFKVVGDDGRAFQDSVAKAFGVGRNGGTIVRGRKKFRIQILGPGDKGHDDHVHVGIRPV